MVTAASRAYLERAGIPRLPADLAPHACTALLTLERDVQDEWQFAKQNKREKIKFAPKLIADGEALREAALAGCGVIRVLAWEIADQLRSGALLQLQGCQHRTPGMVFMRHGGPEEGHKAVTEQLRERPCVALHHALRYG